jgi:hypothetical protein
MPIGSQVNGSDVIDGRRTGTPTLTATRRPSRSPSGPDPDLGEQPVAALLGVASHGRQPLRRRVEQRLLDPAGRERQS